MKIAVNARFLLKNKLEGIGWYSYEVLKRMVLAHPEHTFLFIFDRAYHPEFIFASNVIPLVVPPPARHPVLWHIWFQIMIPRVLKKHQADVFFSPDGFIPLKTNVKTLAVIHDINFERFPEFVPPVISWYYRRHFRRFARKADKIITVSAFSASEISLFYGIDLHKMAVIHNGVNDIYRLSTEIEQALDKKYFLFVGALSPRKNIEHLLRAFEYYKTNFTSDAQLTIVGEQMHLNKQMHQIFQQMKYKGEVRFLGRLSLEELVDCYRQALALVFIPYYEGFGIPLVEAMAIGLPVIASDIDVLKEIALDNAVYVPPINLQSIAEAMNLLEHDEAYRNRLAQKGLQRASHFSWDKSAEKVWQEIAQFLQ